MPLVLSLGPEALTFLIDITTAGTVKLMANANELIFAERLSENVHLSVWSGSSLRYTEKIDGSSYPHTRSIASRSCRKKSVTHFFLDIPYIVVYWFTWIYMLIEEPNAYCSCTEALVWPELPLRTA